LAHGNLGVFLHNRGQLDEAINHYEESIRLDPGASAFPHRHLGIALQDKGRLDEAIDHLQQAASSTPPPRPAASSSIACSSRRAMLSGPPQAWTQGGWLKRSAPVCAGKHLRGLGLVCN
jgi:tetratricopeptide (TPR) repeat protein